MLINNKNIIVDIDNSVNLSNVSSPYLSETINLYRETEYVFKLSLYNSWDNTNVFPLTTTDRYCIYVGDVYGSNSAPVIVESNASSFNQTADWSDVDPTIGLICFRLPTTSDDLATDLGNSASKNYTLQVWLSNDNDEGVLLLDTQVKINNVAVEP